MNNIVVIGGGAAGMMAAGFAAKSGKSVTLIEKNYNLGKKLLITGKGRCNITNNCEVRELIINVPVNGKFLTNVFYNFPATDVIAFFQDKGLPTKIERGNRVFPVSDRAGDVVEVLEKFMLNSSVDIIYRSVTDIKKFGNIFALRLSDNKVLRAESVIIATGGKSYPGTGSTGDGYKFAREFGHKIIPTKSSLVPIEAKFFLSEENLPAKDASGYVPVMALQGLALKNAAIKILDNNGKTVYSDFGEMLFTHYGVSGPMILSASSKVCRIDNHKLSIDLKPALDEKQLDARLQRDFKLNSNKKFENILKFLVPKKLIPIIIQLSEIQPEKQVNQICKTERKKLVFLLKNLSIKLEKFRSLKEAIITSGGVDVKEINPKTMESKLVEGLYFAGEVIDCDAYTGGFNLQIAWSTGFAAGNSCADKS
jgi:predicted Rossmann fold flavoprotein